MGGASQIEAELNLLRRASTGRYDYYHFMQGADFPIKTKEEIERFFEINRGCEFIDYEPGNYGNADRTYLFETVHTPEIFTNIYEWCEDGITAQRDNLQDVKFEE